MVSALIVIGGVGGSVIGNLRLVAVCAALALCIGPLASAIHRLRGWRRIAANVAMTLTALLIIAATSTPHILALLQTIIIDCDLFWWDIFCWI